MYRLLVGLFGLLIVTACSSTVTTGWVSDDGEGCEPFTRTRYVSKPSDAILRDYFTNGHKSDLLTGLICKVPVPQDSVFYYDVMMSDGRVYRFFARSDYALPPSGEEVVLAIKWSQWGRYVHAWTYERP